MLAQIDYMPEALLVPWLDDLRWWRHVSYQDDRLHVGRVPLPRLVERLAYVFDESTCERWLLDGYWAPLVGLFTRSSGMEAFGVMIALGADLVELGDEEVTRLAPKLRVADQWLGYRVEAGAGAGLTRHGFKPRRPSLVVDQKQWDWTIDGDGHEILVESKALTRGDADGNLNHVEQRFLGCTADFSQGRRFDAQLHLSSLMRREMRRRMQPFYECVLPEFTEELTRTLHRAAPDARPRHVGRFGVLVLAPCVRDNGFLGQWTVHGHERYGIHHLRRVMNLLGEATENFEHAPPGAHRVALLWTGKDYVSSAWAAAIVGQNLGRRIAQHGTRIDVDRACLGFETGVVLSTHSAVNVCGWPIEAASLQLDSTRVLPHRVLEALTAWSYHAELQQA